MDGEGAAETGLLDASAGRRHERAAPRSERASRPRRAPAARLSGMLQIEILTFEGCPNAAMAHERVREALRLEDVSADVEAIDVATIARAQETRFLGSPSVRVNGTDVESSAGSDRPYGLICRTYRRDGQIEGAPSVLLIRAAIKSAGRSCARHSSVSP